MTILDQSLLLLVSFVSNTLSAMAGGGAGLLQLPAIIFLGLPFSLALTTHKIATVALGLGATFKNRQSTEFSWPFIFLLVGTGLPGVILGANIILHIPDKAATLALGCLTMGLGLYAFFNKSLGQQAQALHRSPFGWCIGGAVLFLLGVLNGSLTSGTGLFVTMWLIIWFGFDYKQAVVHTMILVGIFWNGAGALTLAMLTPVQWDWLPMLLLGSVLGGYFGAYLAIRHGNPLIKWLFQIITILVGLTLIFNSVR